MNVSEFVSKWQKVELTERSASQQHFLDLCEVFDHPKPALDDPTGEKFTFEKGADKHGGGHGWADAWKRGFFGWEYKGKHKDLNAAYDQLLRYREALESPPLLVVCDMDRFVIHTNFTATAGKTYEISLDDLDTPRSIEILRNVFHDPEKLRPDATSEAITKQVAERLAEVAQGLRKRGLDSTDVARFLDRIVFCLQLAKRTLTNLYNERPTWLDLAHRKLDEAVFAAYGWNPSLSDDEILAKLLALNQEQALATQV